MNPPLKEEEPTCGTGRSSSLRLRPSGTKRQQLEEPRKEYRWRVLKQFCVVAMGSVGHFCIGTILTWPSPGLADMALNNKTLVGTEFTLTDAQMDMAGSLVQLGSLFGAFFAGWLVNVVGRRRSLQINTVPYFLGWIITGLSSCSTVFLLGRFLSGLGVGLANVAVNTYIMETADTKLRGTMSVVPVFCIVFGGQYTLGLGTFLPWHSLSLVCLAPVLLMVFASFVIPESPSFLVLRGQRVAAAQVLKRLRGNFVDVEEEMDDLERRNQSPRDRKSSGYKVLFRRKIMARLGIVILTFLFQQLCGNFILIVQTGRVLEAAGTLFDPATAASIVVSMRIAGTFAVFFLVDRIGRKYCLVVSHSVNACSLIVLGTFVYLNGNSTVEQTFTSLKWIPMFCVATCLFFGDIGLHPLPFTLAVEYFPTSVRSLASSVCMSCGTIFAFVTLQLYSPMQEFLTQAGLYWFYAGSSVVATVFTLALVTETKDKPIG
ncbi:facilitated trehalose transporter Tret1-like isoform X2 [Macrobrachium nipponense]|uniref:facilitated trehalose transporter Tret1-like isoform X2 n=1 Tax=Macrobrachium nipponense TaxID=159736 RepID=UPI0030C7A642